MLGCGGYFGWMWFWPVLILAGLAALIALAVMLARGGLNAARNRSESAGADSSARRILDERYARGELDEDDYRQRRDTLH